MKTISLEKQAMVEAFEKKALAERDNTPISGTRLMAEITGCHKAGHEDRG